MTDHVEKLSAELVGDLEPRAVNGDDASAVRGGKGDSYGEAQALQTLSAATGEVMKNFGAALNTTARGG